MQHTSPSALELLPEAHRHDRSRAVALATILGALAGPAIPDDVPLVTASRWARGTQ